ncbi:protein kinase [Pendulispora rubella]|uniref:Protein kinase n=1 Tax=Pendulispora rubella TaxID=2741070 RepID=A0ABZ2L814_9BACT
MQQGDIVAERFRIDREIGKGGMGIVYSAHDLQANAPVALKVLGRSEDSEGRFMLEATLLSELGHPSIVSYIAHGMTTDGQPYLAMEWLDGEDLGSRLQWHRDEDTGLELDEALRIFRHLAEALAHAHAHGVIHRDIKPSNVFLLRGTELAEGDSGLRLLDFGIARLETNTRTTMTATGRVIGTPGYMAPEQIRGEKVDARADVFSLGCLMFECITGRPAFVANHALAVLLKIVLEEPPRLRDRLPDVPEELDDLVAAMLSKERSERPLDGGAVLARLREIGAHRGVMSIAPSSMMRVPVITEAERRLVSVVVAGEAVTWDPKALVTPPAEASLAYASTLGTSEDLVAVYSRDFRRTVLDPAALADLVRPFGAKVDRLGNGALVMTLWAAASETAATDQAMRAARCALVLRAAMPWIPMALATGRRELGRTRTGPDTVDEAIERAARLFERELDRPPESRIPLSRAATPRPSLRALPIRIDEVTAALLDARFEVAGTGDHLELHGEREHIAPARTLLGRPAAFVGRERELSLLDATFDECVSEKSAQSVLVTAPAGMGKSRLREEFLHRLEARAPNTRVWLGSGDSMRQGSPFSLLAPAVRRHAGLVRGEPAHLSQQKIVARVAERVPRKNVARVAAFVGELATVPFPDDASPELSAARRDPSVMFDQIRRAWQELLAAETASASVIVVIEDMHWADLPSVQCLGEALRDLHARPWMLLALARPEVHEQFPDLRQRRKIQEISLSPLSRAAAERFVRDALGERVGVELLARLVERAEGNAFYLEELIRAIAQGKNHEGLPDTILAMVHTHLERLQPRTRRVLRAASVFGEVFWRGGVAELLGGTQRAATLSRELSLLLEEEIIVRRGAGKFAGEDEYGFRHALLRDGAYAMLTDDDRAAAHRVAGAWLERSGEDDAGYLAEHYELAGDPVRALDWWCRAAEQAFEANHLDAALRDVERAVAKGVTGERLGSLRLVQAETYIWRNDHERAAPWLDEASANLPRGSALWCKSMAGKLVVHAHHGNVPALAGVVGELQSIDPLPEARAAYVMPASFVVSFACALGIYPMADAFLRRLLSFCDEPTKADPVAWGWALLAQRQRARFLGGNPCAYKELGEACVRSFERAGDTRNGLLARAWWGHATLLAGAAGDAEEMMREMIPQTERIGLAYAGDTARAILALAIAQRGLLDEAAHEASIAATSLVSHNRVLAGFALTALAHVHRTAGALEKAETTAREAAGTLIASPPYRAHALAVLAEVLLDGGRLDEAREAATSSHELLTGIGTFEDAEARIRLVYAKTRESPAEALQQAHTRLMARAAFFHDAADRERFLHAVPENRELLAQISPRP